MKKLWLDFETRSRVDITREGAYKYANGGTEMLCAAVAHDGEVQIVRNPQRVREIVEHADEIHAHNAAFERLITKFVLGVDVPPEKWRCSAARCRHANIPASLDGACEALDLPEAQRKDKLGSDLIKVLCCPRPSKQAVNAALKKVPESEYKHCGEEFVNDEALLGRLYAYCQRDVVAERGVEARLPPLPESEQRLWELDRRMNERGFPIDVEFCKGASEIIEQANEDIRQEAIRISGGAITSGKQIQRILRFVNERGVNIGDLQSSTVETLLKQGGLHPDVKAILRLREAAASAAVGKYKSGLEMVCADGRLREGTLYYGASATGRRAAFGFNPLNMKRGVKLDEGFIEAVCLGDLRFIRAMYSGDPLDLLGAHVRGIICAPVGRQFVDADSAQIELRIVHWLAGDMSMMEALRNGFDPYIALYAKTYGVHPSTVTREQRQHAKCLALGMQYAMGYDRAKVVTGLDFAGAKALVDAYRAGNPDVAAMWDRLVKAGILAIQKLVPVRCGRLLFNVEGDWLTMRLPSGRKLYYYKPQVGENKHGFPCIIFQSKKGWREIGGGHILENASQAICRDLLCYWMLQLDADGITCLFDVYDQILTECADDAAEDTRRTVEHTMCQTPEWADGLPVGAEATIKRRFEK